MTYGQVSVQRSTYALASGERRPDISFEGMSYVSLELEFRGFRECLEFTMCSSFVGVEYADT